MIYLDNAATTMQKPPEVYRAVQDAMEHCASVGRSGHKAARMAAQRAYSCRCLAAELFDAVPENICFTFNATHGINIAIHSLVKPGDKVVISGYEHNAVLRPLSYLGANISIAGKSLYRPKRALKEFSDLITDDTAAVVCNHVSNVFGYVLPIEEIADICNKRKVPFIVDASQSAGVLPLSFRNLNAAFIAMPGHKGLYGPQGTGILICGQSPKPLIQGGTGSVSSDPDMPSFLPDRVEAGTHNVPGICGLEAGLRFILNTGCDQILQKENELVDLLCSELRKLQGIRIFHDPNHHNGGVLSIQLNNMDCEELAAMLADENIAVRAGLHCAPLAHHCAGTAEEGTLRISLSFFTKQSDIFYLIDVLRAIQNNKNLR